MDRISSATSSPNENGAGKAGFTDGSLIDGIPATNLNAAWCNGVQEELLNLIEGAGLTPDAAKLDQVRTAIQKITQRNTYYSRSFVSTALGMTTSDTVSQLVTKINRALENAVAGELSALDVIELDPSRLHRATLNYKIKRLSSSGSGAIELQGAIRPEDITKAAAEREPLDFEIGFGGLVTSYSVSTFFRPASNGILGVRFSTLGQPIQEIEMSLTVEALGNYFTAPISAI